MKASIRWLFELGQVVLIFKSSAFRSKALFGGMLKLFCLIIYLLSFNPLFEM